jgi:hypothetical protein
VKTKSVQKGLSFINDALGSDEQGRRIPRENR